MMKETINDTAATAAAATSTTKCEVVAPSDLPAGYQFDATLDDGRTTIPVTVPPGGVRQGQSFPVMYSKQEETTTTRAPVVGRWRNGLFSCCDTAASRFFMGFCCPGILMGQTMQRLQLNPLGRPGYFQRTCSILTVFTILVEVVSYLLYLIGLSTALVTIPWKIFVVIALTTTRLYMRRKYNIPADCANVCGRDSCMADCCCSCWCTPCVIIQMSRHTHDECTYPYECGSPTGLSITAPSCTEQDKMNERAIHRRDTPPDDHSDENPQENLEMV